MFILMFLINVKYCRRTKCFFHFKAVPLSAGKLLSSFPSRIQKKTAERQRGVLTVGRKTGISPDQPPETKRGQFRANPKRVPKSTHSSRPWWHVLNRPQWELLIRPLKMSLILYNLDSFRIQNLYLTASDPFFCYTIVFDIWCESFYIVRRE